MNTAVVENSTVNPILRRHYGDYVLNPIRASGRTMKVHELVQKADFVTMFGALRDPSDKLENLWVTKPQREAFCVRHSDKLSKHGLTFFLRKEDETKPATLDNLVVDRVRVISVGLDVNVSRFECRDLWQAEAQHRMVSPLNSFFVDF